VDHYKKYVKLQGEYVELWYNSTLIYISLCSWLIKGYHFHFLIYLRTCFIPRTWNSKTMALYCHNTVCTNIYSKSQGNDILWPGE
jgi:hypothetical protein